MASLTVPFPLPRLNDVIRAAKIHWSLYATEKDEHTRKVHILARAARLRPVVGPVRVLFQWYPPNWRVDLDNLSAGGQKCILDGLVAAGVLPGDGPKWVIALTHEYIALDRQTPHVVVSWQETVAA